MWTGLFLLITIALGLLISISNLVALFVLIRLDDGKWEQHEQQWDSALHCIFVANKISFQSVRALKMNHVSLSNRSRAVFKSLKHSSPHFTFVSL